MDGSNASARSSGAFAGEGIPNPAIGDWGTPEGWEQFRAQYGYYPFGIQDGAMVLPPNPDTAPDWAREKMGLRRNVTL
jgi:hypothetical protein